MLLQWSHLFEPYTLNFVQFRPVVNLTWTATYNDTTTPWQTVLQVFENDYTLQLLLTLSSSTLKSGTYYEFRLGYPFPTHTFYTNSIVAKTFDQNSPFVSFVQTQSTNSTISVTWQPPEYAAGIIGYSVQLSYLTAGNGVVMSPSWSTLQLTQVASASLPLSGLSITFGCITPSTLQCLIPFTTYQVVISVLRQSESNSAKAFYVTTLKTVLPIVYHNSSSLYFFGNVLNATFVNRIPNYSSLTSVAQTFLWPLWIMSTSGDVNVSLADSTVQSISNTTIQISLSSSSYNLVMQEVILSGTPSPLFLQYGNDESVVSVSHFCLLTIVAF